jgi:hypothetical protein
LRERFAEYENVRIERVGGEGMTTFQVWVDDVPAKSVAKNSPRGIAVTVEMKSDQLRSVKGNVNIGANELSASGVKAFLKKFL